MSTIQAVKTQLNNLIDIANSTTGKEDTTLTDSVNSLISYGQGREELNIHYGDTTPEDTSKLWCKCDKPDKVMINSHYSMNGDIISGKYSLDVDLRECKCVTIGDSIFVVSSKFIGRFTPFENDLDEFSQLSESTEISSYSGVASVNENIYLIGGYNDNSIRVWNTQTNELSLLNVTLPEVRWNPCTIAIDSKIYIFGGEKSSTERHKTILVFDVNTLEIIILDEYLPDGYGRGIGAVGDNIYIFGGAEDASKQVFKFNTITNTIEPIINSDFEKLTANNDGLGYMGVGTIDDKIYLFGGYRPGLYQDVIGVFDPVTQKVDKLSVNLPFCNRNMGVGVINGKAYLFGQSTSDTEAKYYVRSILKFTPKLALAAEQNKLLIHTSAEKNVFNILNGNVILKTGVKAVYLGNESKYEPVEALLYKNWSWTEI